MEQTKSLLRAGIKAEVQKRGREYSSTEGMEAIIHRVALWLIKDCDHDTPGLLLCGGIGNGKTTIIRAIQSLLSFIDYDQIVNGENRRVRLEIKDAREIVNLSRMDYHRYVQLRDCDFLGIDELGCEPLEANNYGNVTNPVIELLSYRYATQMPTLVTTNLGVKAIRETYGARIADRFNEMMTKIIVTDKSFR